ncbi:metal ABC transporter permease [Geodermatophilus marinus]|uniref:metal ABC transporter permease n=1 Tax=Geodermatophilus sp. LHW52908 TaxID=2303986 RepID=UPI0018F2905C|nr:metal ABC transporter permease [Geodermatophilus sp. LHW52908]
MSPAVAIVLTAGLTATACGLLGPLLVLRREALVGDAVSHSVLPGIVLVHLVLGTRATLPVIVGAAAFGVVCVLALEALRSTGLVRADAAIALVFPALFSLGLLGVDRWAADIHLDLDSTIYGQIAFVPFRTLVLGAVAVPQSVVAIGAVALVDLLLLVAFWKQVKVATFDPGFARTTGVDPTVVARVLLTAVAATAVTAFEAVGAIVVIALLVVPAATAHLLTDRLGVMIAVSVAVGWVAAVSGYAGAVALDASIGGAMGVVATCCFVLALLLSPQHGVLTRALRRRQRVRAAGRAAAGRGTAAVPPTPLRRPGTCAAGGSCRPAGGRWRPGTLALPCARAAGTGALPPRTAAGAGGCTTRLAQASAPGRRSR